MSGNNHHRGDVSVTVGGKDYTICYDLNACALVMRRLNIDNFSKMAEGIQLNSVAIDDLLYVAWAGFQRHHEDLSVTDVGGMDWDLGQLVECITDGFTKGLTRDTAPEGGDQEKEDPQNRGTGNAPN